MPPAFDFQNALDNGEVRELSSETRGPQPELRDARPEIRDPPRLIGRKIINLNLCPKRWRPKLPDIARACITGRAFIGRRFMDLVPLRARFMAQ